MSDKVLTRELVRHVLGKFGLIPPPNFGKVGISTDEFILKDTLDIEYRDDDNVTQTSSFPLWAGEGILGKSKMKVLGTDLVSDNYHEFCVTFCVDNLAIYGVKHIFSDQEDAVFLTSRNRKDWSQLGLYEKLMASAGVIRAADLGIVWEPCFKNDELYTKLVDLIEL